MDPTMLMVQKATAEPGFRQRVSSTVGPRLWLRLTDADAAAIEDPGTRSLFLEMSFALVDLRKVRGVIDETLSERKSLSLLQDRATACCACWHLGKIQPGVLHSPCSQHDLHRRICSGSHLRRH